MAIMSDNRLADFGRRHCRKPYIRLGNSWYIRTYIYKYIV